MEDRFAHSEQTPVTVELNDNERLMRITLELPVEAGDLIEWEEFIEEDFFVREREFETFVKVLHYNRVRYRVETIY